MKTWLEILPAFEGEILYMYLDGGGIVTTGCGHALQTPQDAVNVFADPDAARQWQAVKHAVPNQPATAYAALTTLRLSVDQLQELLTADKAMVDKRLLRDAPDYQSWPAAAQDACRDITFNVGNVSSFPSMLAAIRAKNWPEAAVQSRRKGIQEARNQWAADCFLSLADSTPATTTEAEAAT